MLYNQKLNLNLLPKWIPILLLIIALVGFSDATYLTVEHYLNKIPPCTIGGCETVLSSPYSKILGIPVSLLGSLYYFVIILSLFTYFDTKKEIFIRLPIFISVLGFVGSIWLITIMSFIIKAFCPYCALSALSSLLIFLISLFTFLKYKERNIIL